MIKHFTSRYSNYNEELRQYQKEVSELFEIPKELEGIRTRPYTVFNAVIDYGLVDIEYSCDGDDGIYSPRFTYKTEITEYNSNFHSFKSIDELEAFASNLKTKESIEDFKKFIRTIKEWEIELELRECPKDYQLMQGPNCLDHIRKDIHKVNNTNPPPASEIGVDNL